MKFTRRKLIGSKIRVPVSPMWTSMSKAFDSPPASINTPGMYTALQTKVVDAQENPLCVVSRFTPNDGRNYCSQTNHKWDGFWFLANRRAWERSPVPRREIATKHSGAAVTAQRFDMATAEPRSAAGPERQGHGLQHTRHRCVPRQAPHGRVLLRMESQVRRRGMTRSQALGQQVGLQVKP